MKRTASKIVWFVSIWAISVGILALFSYGLRFIIMPG
ncbi:DUF2474 family protein [Vibrio sp. RE86]|nr:DUF2474 family protein [Vibrio sp. RE86]